MTSDHFLSFLKTSIDVKSVMSLLTNNIYYLSTTLSLEVLLNVEINFLL